MTIEEMTQSLNRMLVLFHCSTSTLTKIEIDAWFEQFGVLPFEIFDKATKDYVKTAKFFPKPCEILAHVIAIGIDFRSKYFEEKSRRFYGEETPKMTDEDYEYYDKMVAVLDSWVEGQEIGRMPRGGLING